MANSQETSGYGYDSAAGCSCLRWFCVGGEAEGRHFLLRERGVGRGTQKLKNFTWKIGEIICHHMKFTDKRPNQFHYSPQTYALNFACEHQQDENGDLLHSFSSRFASRPLINDQQRRMAALSP